MNCLPYMLLKSQLETGTFSDLSLLVGYPELQGHKLTNETISAIWPPGENADKYSLKIFSRPLIRSTP